MWRIRRRVGVPQDCIHVNLTCHTSWMLLLRYKLSASERDLFFKAYAARHFERMDGRPDEVDPVALQAAKDRLDPMEADRRAYRKAKLEGRLDEYWAAEGREDAYSRVYGGPRTA